MKGRFDVGILRKRNKVVLIAAFICVLAIMGFWLFVKNKIAHFKMPTMPPASVTASIATPLFWQSEYTTNGVLAAREGIEVESEIAGRVTKILFKSGQVVKAGTPLIILNQDILKAQLASSTVQLNLDKTTYQRNKKIFLKGVSSQEALDQAFSAMQAAQAQTDMYQAQLNQTVIKAPFSGNLGLRQISLGDYITPGQSLVSLQQLNNMQVNFNIPDVYLNQIHSGMDVAINSKSYLTHTLKGKVIAFDASVDPDTQILPMRATINNAKLALIPGTFVSVTLMFDNKTRLITLPQTAIVYSVEGDYVYLIKNHKALRQYVTIGQRRGDNIAILKGLKDGQQVITAGQLKVHDGDVVNIISSKV